MIIHIWITACVLRMTFCNDGLMGDHLALSGGLLQAPLNPLKTRFAGPPGLSGGPGPLGPHRNSTTATKLSCIVTFYLLFGGEHIQHRSVGPYSCIFNTIGLPGVRFWLSGFGGDLCGWKFQLEPHKYTDWLDSHICMQIQTLIFWLRHGAWK